MKKIEEREREWLKVGLDYNECDKKEVRQRGKRNMGLEYNWR